MVVGWSGDIKQAQKRAAAAKNGVDVGYFNSEGRRADVLRQSRDFRKICTHVAEAHAFIDYLLRPEVAALNSNLVAYANGNLASQKLIDRSIPTTKVSIRTLRP